MDSSGDKIPTSFFEHSIANSSSIQRPNTIQISPNSSTMDASSSMNNNFEFRSDVKKKHYASFKRWNSLPMGMNYCSIRSPESSSSSSSSEEEEENEGREQNGSNLLPSLTNIDGRKASISSVYEDANRRPSSASGGIFAVMRHRSSSSALYLPSTIPFRLLDKGIEKLKREANVRSCIQTDYAGEKMSLTGAAIMYSMDEFNIAESTDAIGAIEQRRRTQSLTEPVHVLTNLLPASCSPSPTRIAEKQCYSPSMQQVVRSIAMSPTSSPSPTRRQCLRSLSPIALRTGMALKRKYESDSDNSPSHSIKRAHYSVPTTPPVSTVETVRTPILYPQIAQMLNHSLSESSIDSECSNSTFSSDFTNASNVSSNHLIYRPLSNNAAGISSISTITSNNNNMDDFPIIEESMIDDEDS